MNTYSDYSLRSILNVIIARKGFVIKTTLLAIVLGVGAYFIFPKEYKAETVFILRNPQLTDRNSLYGGNAGYFASEDDISKFISMSESDSFHNKLITGLNLGKEYNLDTSRRVDYIKLKKVIATHLQIYRAENNNVVLLYFDKDPELAANVANYSIPLLDFALRSFYTGVRKSQIVALTNKIAEQDSIVSILTDSLVKLREEYGIYDIINPARHNIMSGRIENSGRPGFARGIEVIQNIASVKDEMVASKATNITLLGQYTTGTKLNDQPITDVLKIARPPVQPVLRFSMVLILCTFAGLLCGLLYVLLAHAWYQKK